MKKILSLSYYKRAFKETVILLRNIPSPVVALFVVSIISMNLLANKTIYQTTYLAIDGGILLSWLTFLCMDMVTKHFGPRASTRMSIFAMFVNLLACLLFYIASIIPTNDVMADYTEFNRIIGGTWFILLSSAIAFISSALINNILNFSIGKLFKNNPDGRLSFYVRSYVSTFVAQFFDNFIFSILTFMLFAPIFWDGFSWTLIQCVTCSLVGAAVELACEVIFSPIGYIVTRRWRKEGVGEAYFTFIRGETK